ncbi:MAG TPA: lasso peptide biosynthesis B2 protein, partial [Polyangiaceae bacterium]|nr:lasso peptide biosynthesis B2 protein [Polyangiaceae bacterium]
ARLSELIWAVEAAGRRVPRDIKCLPRALALQRMLRRRGAAAEVRFGARRVDGEFRAHAWLEYGGTVILGNLPDLQEYSVFSEWPAL